jgi:hypothetical protein
MPGMLTFLRWRVESEVGETMQNGATAGICENYKIISHLLFITFFFTISPISRAIRDIPYPATELFLSNSRGAKYDMPLLFWKNTYVPIHLYF